MAVAVLLSADPKLQLQAVLARATDATTMRCEVNCSRSASWWLCIANSVVLTLLQCS